MSLFKKAKSFHGGVHPNEYKELTENSAFEIMPNPAQIIVPISQHIGKPANPLVKKGDEVSLVGFGSWSVSRRSAREGRNPSTGKTIQIKAKNVVKFKAGSDLSGAVN